MQTCVRRGADAFLVKPLGSEAVATLWQYMKERCLADGSFKRDKQEARERSLSGKSAGGSSDRPTRSLRAALGVSDSPLAGSRGSPSTAAARIEPSLRADDNRATPAARSRPVRGKCVCGGHGAFADDTLESTTTTLESSATTVGDYPLAAALAASCRIIGADRSDPLAQSVLDISEVSETPPKNFRPIRGGEAGSSSDAIADLGTSPTARALSAFARRSREAHAADDDAANADDMSNSAPARVGVPRRFTDESVRSAASSTDAVFSDEGPVGADCKQQ